MSNSNEPAVINSFYASGIGRKLILSLILISSLVTVLITTLQLYRDYQADIYSIEEQFGLVDKIHLPALSESLWSSDLNEAEIHLEGMSHIRDIQYIVIQTEDKIKLAVGTAGTESVLQREYPVQYNYRGTIQEIGKLKVVFSLSGIYQRLTDKVVTILIGNGIKTFIVAFLVLMVFHRLITRHTHQIAAYSSSLDLGSMGQDLVLDAKKVNAEKKDELDVLVDSINEMRSRINSSVATLNEKNASYKTLLESSQAIPWELDLDSWCFTYIGPQAEAILGYSVDDWKQESFWKNHIHKDDKEEAFNFCVTSVGRGDDHEFEYRMIAADGRIVWIRDSVVLVREKGKIVRLQGYMFDITLQKTAGEALQQSEDRFSKVFDSSPVAILITYTDDGRVIDANRAFMDLFGCKLDHIKGKTIQDFGLWLNVQDYALMTEKVRLNGIVENEIYTMVTGEGVHKQCQLAVYPIELGGENCIISVLQDVTKRSRAENIIKTLAESSSVQGYEEFLQGAVKSLAQVYEAKFAFVGMLLPDKSQVQVLAVWAGEAFAENFIYALEGTPCQNVLDLSLEFIPCNAWSLYPDDVMLKDMGVESYFGSPLISSDGEIMGLVAVMDVNPIHMENWLEPMLELYASRIASEMKRHLANEELELHRNHLEDLVKLRTTEMDMLNKELESFSYSVSHDLRAPLRAISGFSQALQEDYADKLDNQGIDFLTRVCSGANRMSALIDDLLNLSRVSRSEIKKEQVDLSGIASSVVLELSEAEPERYVDVSIQSDLIVSGDKNLLKIVMNNLIGNAWKYTGKTKQANIQIGQKKQDGENVYFIKDNGVGFDMKYVSKLFGAFQRLHREEFPGTGIGLATVQRVMQRHSGKIWAYAELEQGATFYFTLGDQAA